MKNIVLTIMTLIFCNFSFAEKDLADEDYYVIEDHYFTVLNEIFKVEKFEDGRFTFRLTQDLYRSIPERYFYIDFESMFMVMPNELSIHDQLVAHFQQNKKLLPASEVKIKTQTINLKDCKKLEKEYWDIYKQLSSQILDIRNKNKNLLKKKRHSNGEAVLDLGGRHPPVYELWYQDYPRPVIYMRSTERGGIIDRLEGTLVDVFVNCSKG